MDQEHNNKAVVYNCCKGAGKSMRSICTINCHAATHVLITSWLPALQAPSLLSCSSLANVLGPGAASRWFIDNIDMFEAITINKAAAAAVEMKY